MLCALSWAVSLDVCDFGRIVLLLVVLQGVEFRLSLWCCSFSSLHYPKFSLKIKHTSLMEAYFSDFFSLLESFMIKYDQLPVTEDEKEIQRLMRFPVIYQPINSWRKNLTLNPNFASRKVNFFSFFAPNVNTSGWFSSWHCCSFSCFWVSAITIQSWFLCRWWARTPMSCSISLLPPTLITDLNFSFEF